MQSVNAKVEASLTSAMVAAASSSTEVVKIAELLDTVVDRLENVSSVVRQKTQSLSTAHNNIDRVRVKTEELVRYLDVSKRLDALLGETTDVEMIVQGLDQLSTAIEYLQGRQDMLCAETALKRSYQVRTRFLMVCKARFLDLLRRNCRTLQFSELAAKNINTGYKAARARGGKAVQPEKKSLLFFNPNERRDPSKQPWVNPASLPDMRKLCNAGGPSTGGPEDSIMVKAYLEHSGAVLKRLLEKVPWMLHPEDLAKELQAMKSMAWEGTAARIVAWRNVLNVMCEFLALQKQLCTDVLPTAVTYVIDQLAAPLVRNFAAFAQTLIASKKSPEKIFGLLDMHEHLESRMPQLKLIFEGRQTKRLLDLLDGLLPQFEDNSRLTFSAVEELVRNMTALDAKKPAEDAGVHPLAAYIINYIKRLQRYGGSLKRLFGDPADAQDWSQDRGGEDEDLGSSEDDAQAQRSRKQLLEGNQAVARWAKKGANRDAFMDLTSSDMEVVVGTIRKLLKLLKTHVDMRSKLYKSEPQLHFFLMNCYAYMSNAARSSVAARVMGKAWFSDLDEGTDQHEDQYFFLVWKPVVDVVKAARLNATADKNKIKDLFTKFNKSLASIHKEQCRWTLGDRELKQRVMERLEEEVGDGYKAFYKAYVSSGFTQNPEKYLVYTPDDVFDMLAELFEGRIPGQPAEIATSAAPSPSQSSLSLARTSFNPFASGKSFASPTAVTARERAGSLRDSPGAKAGHSRNSSLSGIPANFSAAGSGGGHSRNNSMIVHEEEDDEDDEDDISEMSMGDDDEEDEEDDRRRPPAGRSPRKEPAAPSRPPLGRASVSSTVSASGPSKTAPAASGGSMSIKERLAMLRGGGKAEPPPPAKTASPPSKVPPPKVVPRASNVSQSSDAGTPTAPKKGLGLLARISGAARRSASPPPDRKSSAASPSPAPVAASSSSAQSIRDRLAQAKAGASSSAAPSSSSAAAGKASAAQDGGGQSIRERLAAAKARLPAAAAPSPSRARPTTYDDDDDDEDDEDEESEEETPKRPAARGPPIIRRPTGVSSRG